VAKKQHLIKIKFIPVEAWNFAGVHGFRLLGTNAQSAVPALIEIANQNISRESQRDAIMALGYIGPPSKEAVPSLLRFATNADREVRDVTMFALGRTHAEADRVVPVLINALHDPKFGVREGAVVALGLFGPDAKAAGPALVKYLNSAEEFYRPPITNALKAIDPVAAAKAGVK
jgi:HEAT repeat protein